MFTEYYWAGYIFCMGGVTVGLFLWSRTSFHRWSWAFQVRFFCERRTFFGRRRTFFGQRRPFFGKRRIFFKSNSDVKKSNSDKKKVQLQRQKVQLQSQKVVGLGNIPMNLSSQVHLWSSGLWMLEEYYGFWWCFIIIITKVWSVDHIIIVMFINWVNYRGSSV